MSDAITKEEFIRRFVDHMIKQAGETDEDGNSLRAYATEAATACWEDPAYRDDGPEECADADMSYWGDC